MARLWSDIGILKGRIGVTDTSSDPLLLAILGGTEKTIQNVIRSPVLATLITGEWAAPVDDSRLMLSTRPVNIADTRAGTANPILLICQVPYDTVGAQTLMYGVDFTVYNLSGVDPRYSESGMLERINDDWRGNWYRAPGRLGSTRSPARGIANVTYWAGWPSDAIPAVLTEAAYLEAAARWAIRKRGQIYQSESLNGYSYSLGQLMPNIGGKGWRSGFVSQFAADLVSQYIVPTIGTPGLA